MTFVVLNKSVCLNEKIVLKIALNVTKQNSKQSILAHDKL